MNSKLIKICTILLFVNNGIYAQNQYPHTKTSSDIDLHFGVAYPDPYRWMEDMKNPEVEAWFKDQANLTDQTLSNINGRDELIATWKQLNGLENPRINSREFRGGRIFYRKTIPGESVGKVYYRNGLYGEEILLFDPLAFEAGKTLSVSSIVPSHDGKYVGISYSENGAEIGTLILVEVETKKVSKERFSPVWGGIMEWNFDNKGFWWGKLSSSDNTDGEALKNSKVMFHVMGQDVKMDKEYFSNVTSPELGIEPQEWPWVFVSNHMPEYIFAEVGTVQAEKRIYYAPISDIHKSKINWKTISEQKDTINGVYELMNGKIYAATSMGATNFKIIATDAAAPNWKTAETIISEKETKLDLFIRTKDYLVLVYTDGINNTMFKYHPQTKVTSQITLPYSGTGFVFNLDKKSNTIFVNMTSWSKAIQEFEINLDNNQTQLSKFNKQNVYPKEFEDIVVEEVEVTGHDGVKIPLSLIYKKGLEKNGENVCIMESYGAYGASMTPYFNYSTIYLVTKGVVLAYPHVRGGGEKGNAWYKAGFKTTKPNTWKDFNSCAEYLIKNGYTSPKHLAGTGTSAGGILITRAITERPDLYAAAICDVGCANAMRFEATPNGPGNAPEFGTVQDSIECRALYEMDGVAHVQYGVHYPAVMSVAGWTDPRVIAWQPGKFTAAMQNNSKSGKPALLKVNYDNGHFTEDINVAFANYADQLSFMLWQCGHPEFTKKPHQP
ncbi:MAG TPA: prolyl oligopeptidase family serine peptidase [Saprospiraceae bacterium]|nr:prolyl oligopeptidase family serine peptidase [Saprospiraceae bacterium]